MMKICVNFLAKNFEHQNLPALQYVVFTLYVHMHMSHVCVFLQTQNPDNRLRLTLNDFHRAMNSIVPAYTSSQVLYLLLTYSIWHLILNKSSISVNLIFLRISNLNVTCKPGNSLTYVCPCVVTPF